LEDYGQGKEQTRRPLKMFYLESGTQEGEWFSRKSKKTFGFLNLKKRMI
jgi:hypothetical protein